MENKAENSIILKYPSDENTVTDISFFEGEPCPEKLLLNLNDGIKRLFVTDTTLQALPCMKNFISYFTDETPSQDSLYSNGNDFLLILGSGEKFKTIESVLKIVSSAIENDFNRNSVFIGIGGGVITDMTGFASSIFKRGIKCIFVPTTLLSCVDASIGGKTGCDFSSYKNMTGTFHPAEKILIWGSFIKTLSEREFRSGLAEAVKTALLFSDELTVLFEKEKEDVLKRDEKILSKIIRECAEAKARIVMEDFKEKGRRAFLNLGHTFGHALESASGLGEVTHGEAVAWGIARAAELSENLGYAEKGYKDKILKLLFEYGYCVDAVHPSLLKTEDASGKLLSAMHKDKKNNSDSVRVILQKKNTDTFITEVSDSEILKVLKGN